MTGPKNDRLYPGDGDPGSGTGEDSSPGGGLPGRPVCAGEMEEAFDGSGRHRLCYGLCACDGEICEKAAGEIRDRRVCALGFRIDAARRAE